MTPHRRWPRCSHPHPTTQTPEGRAATEHLLALPADPAEPMVLALQLPDRWVVHDGIYKTVRGHAAAMNLMERMKRYGLVSDGWLMPADSTNASANPRESLLLSQALAWHEERYCVAAWIDKRLAVLR